MPDQAERSALHEAAQHIWFRRRFWAVVAWEVPTAAEPEVDSSYDPVGYSGEVGV
jgi:hypothetical protein